MNFTINCPTVFYSQKRPLDQELSQALEVGDQDQVFEVFAEILKELKRDQINEVPEAQNVVDLRPQKESSDLSSKKKASNNGSDS